MRFLDEDQRQQIGLEFVLDQLDLLTPMGRNEKKKLSPYGIRKKKHLLEELQNLDSVYKSYGEQTVLWQEFSESMSMLKDLQGSMKRAIEGSTLTIVELFEIKIFARLTTSLIRIYEKLNLNLSCINFRQVNQVYDLLDPEALSEDTFSIYDAYSDELREVRRTKKELENSISKIRDESQVQKLLQERLALVHQEENLELNIRKDLSYKIGVFYQEILDNLTSFGRLDLLLAKTRLALEYGGNSPCILEDSDLLLENAVNPLVANYLSRKGKKFTPVSLSLHKGVTLLTGANMGGKSITIKTVTLNVMLAQMGFYVFAEKAAMPIYDFIYYISDDMQSIERGLSTFGAEIIKMREVLGAVRVTSGFVALDELARGTNPTEGTQIVNGIVHFLKDKPSHVLLSSHYDGINREGIRHYQVIGLKNVDFEKLKRKVELSHIPSIDTMQEHMDYRLEEVKKAEFSKDALKIAELLGLDKEVLTWIQNKYKE